MAESPRKKLLEDAIRAVTKERNNTYGPPTQDFDRISELASVLFRDKLAEGQVFTSENVAQFLILMKLSRTVWNPTHEDSWMDTAGYAACGYECATSNTPTKSINHPLYVSELNYFDRWGIWKKNVEGKYDWIDCSKGTPVEGDGALTNKTYEQLKKDYPNLTEVSRERVAEKWPEQE